MDDFYKFIADFEELSTAEKLYIVVRCRWVAARRRFMRRLEFRWPGVSTRLETIFGRPK